MLELESEAVDIKLSLRYILLKKSFAPLTLISLYFKLKIPVKHVQMIGSRSHYQRLFSEPITLVFVKDKWFPERRLFVKTQFVHKNAKLQWSCVLIMYLLFLCTISYKVLDNFTSYNFFLDIRSQKVSKFSKVVTFAIFWYYPLDSVPEL